MTPFVRETGPVVIGNHNLNFLTFNNASTKNWWLTITEYFEASEYT